MSERNPSLPPINEAKDGGGMDGPREKWVPKNWQSFKRTERDLKKLAPQMRSRYQAYEGPNKEAADAQTSCQTRLIEKKREQRRNKPMSEEEVDEKDKHEKLIGQLKAAEARNRIRIMRLRYEANRGQEINHLIMCQPTARKAVRLQALLPAKPEDRTQGDSIDKLSRARVEALLEDSRGLLTGRT